MKIVGMIANSTSYCKKIKYKCLSTGTAYILEHCAVNFTSYNTCNKQLADQKGEYFVAL